MVIAQLLDVDGKLIRDQAFAVDLQDEGGTFVMPEPAVRTGRYLLVINGQPPRAIFVWATTHDEAWFRLGDK
jgi:hypothetical protein